MFFFLSGIKVSFALNFITIILNCITVGATVTVHQNMQLCMLTKYETMLVFWHVQHHSETHRAGLLRSKSALCCILTSSTLTSRQKLEQQPKSLRHCSVYILHFRHAKVIHCSGYNFSTFNIFTHPMFCLCTVWHPYLSELLQPCDPSCCLRSADRLFLKAPRWSMSSEGTRFCCSSSITVEQTRSTYESSLKTQFFKLTFLCVVKETFAAFIHCI